MCSAGRRRRFGSFGSVSGFELREAGPQLPALIPQLPIGLCKTLESFSDTSRPNQGDDGGERGHR
jgi:hypothetical protein